METSKSKIRKRRNGTENTEEKLSKSESDVDLIKSLKAILCELENTKNKLDLEKIQKLKSFKNFEALMTRFDIVSSKQSFFRKYWDIIALCFLNLVFLVYLILFVITYTAPESKFAVGFFGFNENSYKFLSKKWLEFNGLLDDEIQSEECAVPLPSFIEPTLWPIDDCKMCIGLTEIKRVENITKEEFLEKYAYTAVPIIVTDAMKNWTGMSEINFNFLKNLYAKADEIALKKRQAKLNSHKLKSIMKTFKSISDEPRNDEEKDTCQFFPYKTNFQNLREVFTLETNEENKYDKPWYVGWSNCNGYASEILRQHYQRPYFLPDESEMSRLDWIFMGTPDYGAAMHIDQVNNPSWQAQISGIKQWTFKPPAECLLKCSTLYVDVLPGDVIVFDSNRWYHSTFIKGTEISLTIGSEYD